MFKVTRYLLLCFALSWTTLNSVNAQPGNNETKAEPQEERTSAAAKAGAGCLLGGTTGTLIFPGIGTALGCGIGTIFGWYF